MSFTRWFAPALGAVVAAPLLVLGTSPTASAACPTGTVGKFQTAFRSDGILGGDEEAWWYLRGQGLATDVGESADIVLDVAIWPFEKGGNRFTMEAPDGHDFIEVGFYNGKVTLQASAPGGEHAYHPDVMTYGPAAWNNLRIRFDLDDDQAHVTLNGKQLTIASEAGTEIEQVWFANSFRTGGPDTQTAYVDNLTVTKVTGDVRTTLYSEDFEDGHAEASYPALTYVPTIWQPSPGSQCKQTSELTVSQTQTSEKVKVFGAVEPAAPGRDVVVRFFKKRGGVFEAVGRPRRVTLDHASSFRTSFDQPAGTRRCRTTVVFEGSPTMFKDEVTRTFGC